MIYTITEREYLRNLKDNYRAIYDVKDDFIELLCRKADFSGLSELEHYFKYYYSAGSRSTQNLKKKRPLLKFCIYRLSLYLTDGDLHDFDCDSSKETVEFYKKTYGWLKDYTLEKQPETNVKYQLRSPDGQTIITGDTMTSIWTPLKNYIKLKTGVTSIPENDKWELYWLRNFNKIDISLAASHFIELGHAVGNFIPVPPGFNTGRSNFGKWDSWDLTLRQIYQWYQDNLQNSGYTNDGALKKLFSFAADKESSVNNCKKWLNLFLTWEDFVANNYLGKYLTADGTPKLFFKNHSLDYPLPQTVNEYEELFNNVNECITDRGKALENFSRNLS